MRTVLLVVLIASLPLAFAGEAVTEEKVSVRVSEWSFEPSGEPVTLPALIDLIRPVLDAAILYNPNDPALRNRAMTLSGTIRIPSDRVFDWFRSILAYQKLVLVPNGPREARQWVIMNSTDPMVAQHPIHVSADKVHEWADRDGAYIATIFKLEHATDSTRMRTALANLVTRPVGRIQDVPGARAFVVADFAPVVATIARLVKTMDQPGANPAPRRVAPSRMATPRKAPPPARKPTTASTIAHYEQMLVGSRTEAAAQYFLERIAALRKK